MSDFENYSPDESSEVGKNGAEVSEKFKEATKKATAGVQRTQKDERKSQKYDHILSTMLVEIIRNKQFDELLNPLFDCVDNGYPSNFMVGIFSLIYHPVHIKIRDVSKKTEFLFHYKAKDELISFHDQLIDAEIKDRINIWIEDIIDVTLIDPSTIATYRLKSLIVEEKTIVTFFSLIFQFFLKRLNIDISFSKSESYAQFIISEIQKSLKNLALEEI